MKRLYLTVEGRRNRHSQNGFSFRIWHNFM